MHKHIVAQGECVASIAFENGFFWETIWNAAENEALRTLRGNPNVLLPGDEVTIPDKRRKNVSCGTGKRHVFRLRAIPAKLHLVILMAGEPCANEPYVVELDGKTVNGTTGAGGEVDVLLFPNVKSAKLTVGTGDEATEYILRLRELPPISEIAGVQRRLENLGYGSAPMATVLRAFQHDHELPETGEADADTVEALQTAHGV